MVTIAVLLLIALLLAVIAVQLSRLNNRPSQPQATTAVVAEEIRAALNEAGQEFRGAVRQFFEVNTVVEIVDKFADKPELADKLAEYSRMPVMATLLYSLNSLAEQRNKAFDELKYYRKLQGEHPKSAWGDAVNIIQQQIGQIDDQINTLRSTIDTLNETGAVV